MAISITPLHPVFAAEVRGVDLTQPVDDAAFAETEAAFHRYGVLVFPDQPVTDAQQVDFSALFGPVITATQYHRDQPERRVPDNISDISNIGPDGELMAPDDERRMHHKANELWHTDGTFKHVPARCSLLSAREIPKADGNTEFADMRAAYDALPEDRKREIDDLVVEHSIFHSREKIGFSGYTEAARAGLPPVNQVLVRTHPATGRKALYLASHITHVIGWPEEKGRRLIDHLTEHATQPDFVYRHRWRPHDLVLWDNRCTMHRARPYDDLRERRVMHRTTVSDEVNSVEREQPDRAAAAG